jgi:NADH-quinone oxidoreductase subunit C
MASRSAEPGAAVPAAGRPRPPAAADIDALAERFGDAVAAAGQALGEPTALLAAEALVDAARFLRDERGYQLLLSVTAVDYLDGAPRFQVVYHLVALPGHVLAGDAEARSDAPARRLRLKVAVPADDPVVPTVTAVFPTADWHEREVWDMFGIEFAGHPDLRRILMPEGFSGHPLRKDFPLVYEEVAFSFNQEDVYRGKPLAES